MSESDYLICTFSSQVSLRSSSVVVLFAVVVVVVAVVADVIAPVVPIAIVIVVVVAVVAQWRLRTHLVFALTFPATASIKKCDMSYETLVLRFAL